MSDKSESFLDTAARYLKDMVSSGDYSTETASRPNDVKRGVATYKAREDQKGAAANAADAITAHKKMLDEL